MVERRRGNGYFLSGDVEEVMEDWRKITRAIYKRAVDMVGEKQAKIAFKSNLESIFVKGPVGDKDVIWFEDDDDWMIYMG